MVQLPELPDVGVYWCCLTLYSLFRHDGTQLQAFVCPCLEALAPVASRMTAKHLWKRHSTVALAVPDVSKGEESAGSCTAVLVLLRALSWKQPWTSPTAHGVHTTSSMLHYATCSNSPASPSALSTLAPDAGSGFVKYGYVDILLRLLSEIPSDACPDSKGLVFDVFACFYYNASPE